MPTPAGARFASNLVPSSLQPLRFAVTKAEASEYADAITDAITGAGKVIAGDLALGRINVEDVASTYLRDNSLSKLTGEIAAETTKRLQDGLAQAWDRGGSYDQMVAAVKDTFKDFSDTRAGMIAQTETNDAYNEARDKIATDAGMNEKAWETESGDPCPTCVENEDAGYIDIDEDFPSGDDAPTAHPNCFLGCTPILARRITSAIRRWYEGQICILRFACLPDLSVTPNHPILTRRGWVPAGRLNPGDDVAQCVRPPRPLLASMADPDFNEMEASIEQIFDAVSVSGGMASTCVPVTTEAFHGDVQSDAKVDIVWTAGAVRAYLANSKGTKEFSLRLGELRRVALHADGPLEKLSKASATTPHCIVSSLSAIGMKLSGQPGVGDELRGAVATLPKPGEIPSTDNSDTGDSDPFRDFKNAFASDVGFVKLLEVNVREFSGHVFNLSTASGLYLANTIVAHNCMCSLKYRKSS